MTEDEITDLVEYLAENPLAGDEWAGTGGCRKVRIRGRGKGKSGGYRVVTFYSGDQLPVFLIAVFGKGERSTLSKKECNELAKITRAIVDEYRQRVVRVGVGA